MEPLLAFVKMEPGIANKEREETLALIEGAGDVKDARKGSVVRREMQESGESGDWRKGDALLASLLLQSVSFCIVRGRALFCAAHGLAGGMVRADSVVPCGGTRR